MIQLNETQQLLITAAAAIRGTTPQAEVQAWVSDLARQVIGQPEPKINKSTVSKSNRKMSAMTKAKIGAAVKARYNQHGPSLRSRVLDVITKASIGDVSIIKADDASDALRLRKVATSTATKLWGKKTYITAVHADRVEILRIK